MILAPMGRDAKLAEQALSRGGLRCRICGDLDDLRRQITEGAGAVLLADEALAGKDTMARKLLGGPEPAWSQLPLVVLTRRPKAGSLGIVALRELERRYNVNFLQRPVPRITLISTLRSAIENRRRQYVVRDLLDERMKAEQAANEREARLRLALEAGGMGTWYWNVNTGEGSWDARQYELCGFAPGDKAAPTGIDFLSLVHPDDVVSMRCAVNEALEQDGEFRLEFRILRPDGSLRWLAGRGRFLERADDRAVWMVGVNWDITEGKRAEEALRASEQRLRLAQAVAAVGTFEWDIKNNVNRWSPEIESLYGMAQGEFGGTYEAWAACVHPDDLPAAERSVREAMRSGRMEAEWRVIRRDGELVWVQARCLVEKNEAGEPVRMIGANIDITQRKKSEDLHRLLIDELNHRVKNSLAVVQAIARQTFKSGLLSAEACDAFHGRLAALAGAHNLLTRSNWEKASLGELSVEATQACGSGKDRIVINGPRVMLQPRQAITIAMALHELCTNAAKYGALSNEGGRIQLEWDIVPGADPRLKLSWCEKGGPPVSAPAHRGFGSLMIQQALAQDLDGTVAMDFRPEGLVCTIDAPLPQ